MLSITLHACSSTIDDFIHVPSCAYFSRRKDNLTVLAFLEETPEVQTACWNEDFGLCRVEVTIIMGVRRCGCCGKVVGGDGPMLSDHMCLVLQHEPAFFVMSRHLLVVQLSKFP